MIIFIAWTIGRLKITEQDVTKPRENCNLKLAIVPEEVEERRSGRFHFLAKY